MRVDWAGILERPLLGQAWAWESRRKGTTAVAPDPAFVARFAAARDAAVQALQADTFDACGPGVGPGEVLPSKWLRSRGFQVSETLAPARYGHLVLRAVVDLETREVHTHREAVTLLERALPGSGLVLPCPVAEVFLAHEAFHVMAPRCPHVHGELAAHLFCTEALALPFFAGLLDWLA